jgi:hypothetical protein
MIDCDFSNFVCPTCGHRGFPGLRRNCPGRTSACVISGRRRLLPPGDALQTVIYHATRGHVVHGIECELFRLRMNRLGWRGCWGIRGEVVERIRKQATKEGYATDGWHLAGYAMLGVTRWARAACRRRVAATQ